MRYNTSQCGWCGGLIPHYYGLLQYKLWQPEVGSPTCTSPAACPMLIRQKVSAIARCNVKRFNTEKSRNCPKADQRQTKGRPKADQLIHGSVG
eukprot:1181269-Prorocentrum_minimum.AAC.2